MWASSPCEGCCGSFVAVRGALRERGKRSYSFVGLAGGRCAARSVVRTSVRMLRGGQSYFSSESSYCSSLSSSSRTGERRASLKLTSDGVVLPD